MFWQQGYCVCTKEAWKDWGVIRGMGTKMWLPAVRRVDRRLLAWFIRSRNNALFGSVMSTMHCIRAWFPRLARKKNATLCPIRGHYCVHTQNGNLDINLIPKRDYINRRWNFGLILEPKHKHVKKETRQQKRYFLISKPPLGTPRRLHSGNSTSMDKICACMLTWSGTIEKSKTDQSERCNAKEKVRSYQVKCQKIEYDRIEYK